MAGAEHFPSADADAGCSGTVSKRSVMASKRQSSKHRAFMTIDMIAGLALLTTMASLLAAAAMLRGRTAQHLSDQRAAMVIAERTLCEGHAPADPLAQVSIKRTGTSTGGREW